MLYPKSLSLLIDNFQKLPGVGEKSAERMALTVLALDEDEVNAFSKALIDAKSKIKPCSKCFVLTDKEECSFCVDKSRNRNQLCVVSDPRDVISIEKANIYGGLYFVLNALISPLGGINPSSINFDAMFKYIEENNIREIILALKSTIEGETTALYIKKLLEGKKIKITKLASGLPMGIDLQYIDSLTLERAITDRVDIS